ncbi:sialoadhesin-like [Cynoglossus semilaevis]|uniref:Sialoadhesin-like n=1 Tax=Cynoglossus semilaevis TaxID=244447 RepID=A0A3P8VR24_CYNSE|nr:sialoadhesin-like [Cynoglossus semilaevis]XP_024917547.1 sialoadhesin-like [Cynoglossus semilaevis]XP_024917548.1 sialoadhesin-like [Cynoglossus semilaevis]
MLKKMEGQVVQVYWLLFTLSLRGILAGDWSVHLPASPVCAVIGSSVILPCSYDYPQSSNGTVGAGQVSSQGRGGDEGQRYRVLSEIWCLENSRCITPRYVFHSAGILPDPSYQNRVKYLGQAGTKNCSLKISNLRKSDSGTYVFYLITSHPTQKMPEQRGIQLLVADSPRSVTTAVNPSSGISAGVVVRLSCCSPSASLQTQFRWFKSESATPMFDGQVWTIGEISSCQSGSYYCQTQTGDQVRNSTTQEIDVQYSPRNTAVSPGTELYKEPPVTLTCSSDANPPVLTFSWYHGAACSPAADKSLYQARQAMATHTGKGSTFRSANITVEEYGKHCCVARNSHGSQTVTVLLQEDRAIMALMSRNREVVIGVSLSILIVIIAIIAFCIIRRKKSSKNQTYSLTATTAT